MFSLIDSHKLTVIILKSCHEKVTAFLFQFIFLLNSRFQIINYLNTMKLKLPLLLISFITSLCQISFAQNATPNASFENWTAGSAIAPYDNPDDWDNPNDKTKWASQYTCFKSTDAHTGSFAIQLITKNITQIVPGTATTGIINENTKTIDGGVAYTGRPDSIVGYFKSMPASGDYTTIQFTLKGSGGDLDTIATARFLSSTTVNSYTRFSVPLVYKSTNPVVTANWLLKSSPNVADGKVGSTLFVDDLEVIINPATAAASVSIAQTTGTNPVCSGESVTFTATPTNGGTAPTYQWKVNGTNVGTNSNTYTTTTLTNGAAVTCVMTSNLSNVTGSPATSNAINMTVGSMPTTPTITESSSVLTSSSATGNQWYLDGTAIQGATGQTHTATQVGSYTATVTENGCTTPASNAISVLTVGINDIVDGFSFTTFPNPTTGTFTITMNDPAGASYALEIKDVLGRLVFQKNLSNISTQISTTDLQGGWYAITLFDTNNTIVHSEKLLIQK